MGNSIETCKAALVPCTVQSVGVSSPRNLCTDGTLATAFVLEINLKILLPASVRNSLSPRLDDVKNIAQTSVSRLTEHGNCSMSPHTEIDAILL